VTDLVPALAALVALVACGPALARWLRVAQREHYYRGSVLRFTGRWWTSRPLDLALGAIALAGAVASLVFSPAALASAAAVTIAPVGLSIRGRTSPLVWTTRMRLLGGVCVVIDVAAAALALIVASLLQAPGVLPAGVAALAIGQPLVVEAALLLTGPLERRRSATFVAQASARLGRIAPTIVAITGSYGKTTTKQYVNHLLSSTRRVLASPASFNNTGGLARTVNEHLVPGTEVFVAEMGTYGPGEIADLCRWIQPDIAVITAIGPVHLERMGSLDTVVAAKAEILAGARIAVLNIDAHGLAAQAGTFAARGGRVIRCSTVDSAADVWAGIEGADGTAAEGTDSAQLVVSVAGRELARFPAGAAQPGNVACAVGVALALEVPLEAIASQLRTLPVPEHRQQLATNAKGVTVIDDTYNANPAGAASALRLLARQTATGRRVLVTPGMIELGPLQDQENSAFARAAATSVASDVVVVGRTNRTSLLAGARGGAAQVRSVDRREQAVAWVRESLGAGDAVLYENDLPDHYP
jgi:UDP-N-acetylmuramoyl-tripeptide--D-alanyl-D-alanine ligase